MKRMMAAGLVGLLALGAPTFAQTPPNVSAPAAAPVFDPNSDEAKVRGLLALAATGKRCLIADGIEEETARAVALGAIGDNPDAAKLAQQIIDTAAQTACADKDLVTLLAIGIITVRPTSDGYKLAFLDQGFCQASAIAADARLLAVVSDITPERAKAAEAAREQMKAHLKEACAQDYKAMGLAFTLGQVALPSPADAFATDCWSESRYSNQRPFECTYGADMGTTSYHSSDAGRYARMQVRQARAKAMAIELDGKKACKTLTKAQKAVGTAQALIDAQGVKYMLESKRVLAKTVDGELRFETPEEAVAFGRKEAAALTCVDLKAEVKSAPYSAPMWSQGEPATAAAGLKRIRETTDRVMMTVASLPSCDGLPNFRKTKAAALKHVKAMTYPARLKAASEARKMAQGIELGKCGAASLEAFPGALSPLVSLDAISGG